MKRDVWKSNQIIYLSPIKRDSMERNSNHIYMTTLCRMLWGKSFLFDIARGNNNGLFVYFLTTCLIMLNRRFKQGSLFWVSNVSIMQNTVMKSPFFHIPNFYETVSFHKYPPAWNYMYTNKRAGFLLFSSDVLFVLLLI